MAPILIALISTAIAYFHNNIFIDFADEGFLWYGALHIFQGKVPILDFQAYDPGRYYWCAAVLAIFGKGLMSLRLAAGLFQFLSLSLGLLALRRVLASPFALLWAGLLAVFFMLMPCRYFTAGLAPAALFFAVRLIEKSSPRRYLAAGIYTGFAAFIAVNHGFYIFMAFLALMLYLNAKNYVSGGKKNILFYLIGTASGLLPFWWMLITIPGFFGSYFLRMNSVLSAFISGKANVSFPVPWPWTVDWHVIVATLPDMHARLLEFTNRFSIGILFVFIVVWYLFSIPSLVRIKKPTDGPRALFVASIFIGVFYLGHIFSRSDLVYLGEGIFPVMAALLAWRIFAAPPYKKVCGFLIVLFSVASFLSAGLRSTIIFKTMVPDGGMTWYRVGKDRIWLIKDDAKYIEDVKKLVAKHIGPQEPLLLAPFLTTFYCLLERESPVYELYFHIAPMRAMEERTLRELEEKNVRWAIVADFIVDGRPEQALSRSHPLLWRYLTEHYETVTTEGLRPGYALLRRKS